MKLAVLSIALFLLAPLTATAQVPPSGAQADSDLVGAPLFGDCFPPAAEAGVMNGTNLGATEPHRGSSPGLMEISEVGY
jgi:hypothetical protein